MSKPTNPRGLRRRNGVWHIKKTICGRLICESTGSRDLAEAELYLARRTEEIRRASVWGERLTHGLGDAAARYLIENEHARGIARQGFALRHLVLYFGEQFPIDRIHSETIAPYITTRLSSVGSATVVRELGALKAVLRKASTLWRDDQGLTWLERAPEFPAVRIDSRAPRPISWDEQAQLFPALPDYLAAMALFAVNTGCRDQEICGLRWEWEHEVDTRRVFVIPGSETKNAEEKIVPLNSIAQSVVDGERGRSDEFVFTFEGHRLHRMNNRAWKDSRRSVALEAVRVHDLRHTFAVRLRDLGAPMEDIQDLLGHKRKTVTHHYSRATVDRLIRCVDLMTDVSRRPSPVLRRVKKVA